MAMHRPRPPSVPLALLRSLAPHATAAFAAGIPHKPPPAAPVPAPAPRTAKAPRPRATSSSTHPVPPPAPFGPGTPRI